MFTTSLSWLVFFTLLAAKLAFYTVTRFFCRSGKFLPFLLDEI